MEPKYIITALAALGTTYATIAESVGVSPGRISQIANSGGGLGYAAMIKLLDMHKKAIKRSARK